MLSNTATPKYYGAFREAVIRGDIPVCQEIEMEMNRIDDLIRDPRFYYAEQAIDGYIAFCENELTLTDGSAWTLRDAFKLWAEQVVSWFYFDTITVYEPNPDGHGGRHVTKEIKKRLTKKQYLIVSRGSAKSMYGSTFQAYHLNVDTSTTHHMPTALFGELSIPSPFTLDVVL
mgnify:FL=1